MTDDQLDPESFRKWRDTAEDRAEQRRVSEVAQEIRSLAENGEKRTMRGAKILGFANQLEERLSGK